MLKHSRSCAGTVDLQHVGVEVRHTDQRAVAIGRRRIEDVVGGQRAVHAVLAEEICVGHTAHHAMVAVAAHQEQVGRRQHVTRDARVGEPARQAATSVGGSSDSLAMWPTTTRPPRLYCSVSSRTQIDVHGVRRWRQRRDGCRCRRRTRAPARRCVDLPDFVGVVARRAADHLGAALEPLDQQFFGAGIAGQVLLRKHADLDVDRPFVVVDQRLHASKPRMPMPDRPPPGCASAWCRA